MELLDEIWRLIFAEYLDFVDTVRCRRVSKRFKFLADQLGPKELFVYSHMFPLCESTGYRDDRNPLNWIQLHRFQFEPNSSFQIVFANLRVLELDIHLGKNIVKSEKEFNLEFFNEFVHLEKLYLNTVVISRRQTLRLPNLRVFSIRLYSEDEFFECSSRWEERIIYSRQPRLVLDSKVQRLLCYRTKLLDVKHPDRVEFLRCNRNDLKTNPVILFKNLRVLCLPLTNSVANIFEDFQNLEELYLRPISKDGVRRKQWFNELMAKKAALKREVKIYVVDVSFQSDGPLDTSIDFREFDPLKFRIQNYHRLTDRVRDVKEIYYGRLIGWLDTLTPNQIELDEWLFPVGFFKKFLGIKSVNIVRKVEDEDRFLYFLSRCTRLTELEIRREHLTQSLLNRLPAVCRPLKVFTIDSIGSSSSSVLDPRPVYGLKQLFKLEFKSKDTNLDSPLDLAVLFKSCRYLVEVELKYIQILKQKLYHVYCPRESDLTKIDSFSGMFHERAAFNYEDLKKNLGAIIEEYKEMRKRTSSHPIWQSNFDYQKHVSN